VSAAPAEPRDAGTTLIELLVVMVVMSVLGILVSTTVIGGLRTAARAEHRTDDVAAGQQALRQMSSDLRAATQVLVAEPSKVVVRTRTGLAASATPLDAPVQVSYEWIGKGNMLPSGAVSDSDVLVRREQQPTLASDGTWTYTAAAQTWTTLLHGVLGPPAAPRALLTYLSRADSAKQCGSGATVSTLSASSGTVAGTRLDEVYGIEVWLSLNSAPKVNPKAVTLSSAVIRDAAANPTGKVLATDLTKGPLSLPAGTTALGLGQGCS